MKIIAMNLTDEIDLFLSKIIPSDKEKELDS